MHLLLLVAALAAQAAPPAPSGAEDIGRGYYLFLQGATQEKANDMASALESYRQASLALPNSADIRTALARLYTRQNQMNDARREAAAALRIDPESHDGHRLLGLLQLSSIESGSGADSALMAEAITHLEKAVAGGTNDPAVEIALSSLYLKTDAAPRAVERLQKVLSDYPDYPAARRLLVRAYDITGDTDAASATRLALASSPPDEVEQRARQAELFEQAGRWPEAALAWADVVRGDRSDPGSLIYLPQYAAALANTGRFPQARTALQQATRETPRSIMAWYLLALVEARSGNGAAAEEAARHIVTIDASDARGPLGIARGRAAAGNFRGVVDVLSPHVSAPRNEDVESGMFAEMATELSAAYGHLNQNKRATEVLEGARKRAPKDETLLFRLGAAYENDKKYEAAEKAFRDIIAANDQHADAMNYLGYMLADRGQKLPEALDLIKKALAIERDNPAFLDSLGWTYYKLGQLDSAQQPLERAASALPKVSVIQDHLGDLYFQMKRYTDAVAAFERALSGDRDGIDAPAITKKRDRARTLAGKS